MKRRIITIAAFLAVMVALTGVASAFSTSWLLPDGTEQNPILMKNNTQLILDFRVSNLRSQDIDKSSDMTLGFLACTNDQGQIAVNCDPTDISLNLLKTTFQVTAVPITLQKGTVSVSMQAPMTRKTGTQYSFAGNLGPFGAPDEVAQVSLTVELVGGSIAGTKFNDLNGNGIRDAGEPGLQGWTINLKNETGATIKTATTDSNGDYKFTNVRGTLTVQEVLQPGWTQTFPAAPGTHTVTIDSQDVTGKDFGNWIPPNGSIAGQKWNDTDGDGIKDAGEPVLANWQINLKKPDGTTVSMNTDASGNYNFTNLPAGSYIVSETQQAGWTQTAPKPVPPGTHTVALSAGQNVQGKDFGNWIKPTPPCANNICKVVGWGTLGNKAAPELTFQIFAYTAFMPKGVVKAEDSAGNKIEATEITSVVTNKNVDPMTGEIQGMAMFNNEGPFAFVVKVTDGGDPSRSPYVSKDTFEISIPAKNYLKNGKLTSGNLQVIY
ncbi:SdrD B-like domain protein [uncultured archaeon]|nr:SdrD B-like domain protein [uncultured archaeon]